MSRLTTRCEVFDAIDVPFAVGLHAQLWFERRDLSVPCLFSGRHTATMIVAEGTGRFLLHLPGVRVRSDGAQLRLPPAPDLRWDTAPWNSAVPEAIDLVSAQELIDDLNDALRLYPTPHEPG